MCRVCEQGAGRPRHNWNGQALCGELQRERICGNARRGEKEWEEKVTMSTRHAEAVRQEFGMIGKLLQDHEKDMELQGQCEPEVQ